MYVRGSWRDYHGWVSLSNKEWGWDDLVPYFRKHQTLGLPEEAPDDPKFVLCAATDKYYGTNGPIHTSFNDFYMPLDEDFVKAAYYGGKRECPC